MDRLPIYDAVVGEQDANGIYAISLVEYPAVERDFIAFAKDDKPEFKFEVTNKLEHCITGPVALADVPIYRYSPDMGEYYIRFTKDTIKLMAEKMLMYGSHNQIDLQHNEDYFFGKCNLVECYIKDSEKGVVPVAFADIPDGSLMATYKVRDVDLWDKIESGEVKGFSLEGWFDIEQNNFSKQNVKKNNKMDRLKTILKKLLLECGSIATDNGILDYEGDEIVIGMDVTINGEPAPDGDYVSGDSIYVVADGKLQEIKEKEDEPAAEEETTEEETVEAEDEKKDEEEEPSTEEETEEPAEEEETTEEEDKTAELEAKIAELEAKIAELEAENEELKAKLAEPAVDPIEEEFVKHQEPSVMDKKIARACKMASYLKKN